MVVNFSAGELHTKIYASSQSEIFRKLVKYGDRVRDSSTPRHVIKGFVIPTKSFVKIGITKISCYNNKMFSYINKTFGSCGKIFGCSNKNFICCP